VRRRYAAVPGDHLPLVVPGRLTDTSTYVFRISPKSRSDADALSGIACSSVMLRPAGSLPCRGFVRIGFDRLPSLDFHGAGFLPWKSRLAGRLATSRTFVTNLLTGRRRLG